MLWIYKNILTFLPTAKLRNQANRYSQCSLVLLFNALFTLERGFITNVYGLFSGHHFYIHVKFLKYALDLSFLVNVDMFAPICLLLRVLFIRFLKETILYCLGLEPNISKCKQYNKLNPWFVISEQIKRDVKIFVTKSNLNNVYQYKPYVHSKKANVGYIYYRVRFLACKLRHTFAV